VRRGGPSGTSRAATRSGCSATSALSPSLSCSELSLAADEVPSDWLDSLVLEDSLAEEQPRCSDEPADRARARAGSRATCGQTEFSRAELGAHGAAADSLAPNRQQSQARSAGHGAHARTAYRPAMRARKRAPTLQLQAARASA
jgi:hypothetical protein